MSIEKNNLTGLAARYREAFSRAWANRHASAKRDYTAAEAQFLPVALALQETPAPAAPRVAMWLLISFAALTLLWAVFGHIDIVATAPGKIVPNDRSKVIQSVDTATVLAIHVSDGQAVKAGDPLIDLDATDASADADKVSGERSGALLQVARGEALLAALDTNRRPALGAVDGASEAQLLEARRQLSSLFDEHNTKLARLTAEIERRQAELQSTRHMVERLEQTAPIAAQRAADFKDLMEKNFVSKHGFLEREQARLEQEGELAVQRNRLRELDAALRESRQQRASQIAELKRTTLDSIREGQQRADALTQDQVTEEAQRPGRWHRATAGDSRLGRRGHRRAADHGGGARRRQRGNRSAAGKSRHRLRHCRPGGGDQGGYLSLHQIRHRPRARGERVARRSQ